MLTEDDELDYFLRKVDEYAQLEASVQSSSELLTSLASYLSTFQHDLSAVSGQISDLQQRSAEIESRLRGRRTTLPLLDSFLVDITLPPALVLTLRDTTPAQNPDIWLSAIPYLEQKTLVQEIDTVLEGFRTKALTLLPPFLLGLIRPLRSTSKGLSTNLAVLQTSLLLKYQPFFAFLNRQSPKLAKQVERGYVNAARAYYETGIRRYARALGTIKAVEKVNRESALETSEYDRLHYADLVEGEVVLAYMSDDKELALPPEALFRSLGLVLVDNASAEFTFIVRFFADSASEDAQRIWHEVFDPALEYATTFFRSLLNPSLPAIPLLVLIRLNDRFLGLCESRGTTPLATTLQGQRLALWPLYRKEMDRNYNDLKALADEAEGRSIFARGVKDVTVRAVAVKYAGLFSCVTALSEEAEETMLFSSMSRMRTEIVRLVTAQSSKIKSAADRNSFISSMYEVVLHELASGPGPTTHAKLQSELSFFRTREEEARRRI